MRVWFLSFVLAFAIGGGVAPAAWADIPPDTDGDGLIDPIDPCPLDPVHDSVGDPCDHDEDDDNFDDFVDWCPYDPGPDRGCPREDIPTTGCGGPRFN